MSKVTEDMLPELPKMQRFTNLYGEAYAYSADQMRAYARAALEAALSQGEAVAEPNGKLVAWWNGITPGYDGQGNWSIRWGADAENSAHDIPLYDGYNPIHYQQPAPQSEPAACNNCNGVGLIPYTIGQTPETFEQGEYPCPECAEPPQQPTVRTSVILGRLVANLGFAESSGPRIRRHGGLQ